MTEDEKKDFDHNVSKKEKVNEMNKNKVEIYQSRRWELSSKHGDLEIAIINAETISARGKPVRVKDVQGKIVWTNKEGK